MNALEVKISQIKNLNLVYLFNVDNVFRKLDHKYLGLKVIYDGNNYISLDYKAPEFGILIRKIISRYNQEKDNRNIILLGDITEKLFQDDSILNTTSPSSEYKPREIGIFNTSNNNISSFKPYLSETLKLILEHIRNMEGIEILSIDGFNKKYNVTYRVGGVTCNFPIILYFDENKNLIFKIGSIEGRDLHIEGSINNTLDRVDTFFKNITGKTYGYITYDVKNETVEKNVTIDGSAVYHSTEKDVVTDEDINLIKFYLELFGIEFDGEVMRTSDNNFILGNKTKVASDEEAEVVASRGIQICIDKSDVTIRYRVENIINKLKHLITIPLDSEECNISLKSREIDGENYIICECASTRDYGKKYDYVVFKIDEIDLHHPFEVKDTIVFDEEIKTFYDIEKKLRLEKTGTNEGGKE